MNYRIKIKLPKNKVNQFARSNFTLINISTLPDQEILNILIASKSVLNKYGVNKLGLFGSSLYGKASENSDIDILIMDSLSEPYKQTCKEFESEIIEVGSTSEFLTC